MAEVTTSSGVKVLLDEEDLHRLPGKVSIGSHGYAQLWEPELKRMLLLHRWVMGFTAKTGYQFLVDHEDRNVLDCRKSNLKKVDPTESNLNRRSPDRPLPLGVYLTRSGRYQAKLKRYRKSAHYGTYDTPEQAAAALPI
jgi:hypothetical protein